MILFYKTTNPPNPTSKQTPKHKKPPQQQQQNQTNAKQNPETQPKTNNKLIRNIMSLLILNQDSQNYCILIYPLFLENLHFACPLNDKQSQD